MKTKKDFNPLIDSRLVHKDYDMSIEGPAKRKLQQDSKNELIEDFRKNFGLDGTVFEHTLESKDGSNLWYYSTSHASGTTMIMFAKWIVGLDCQYKKDVPANYSQYLNSNRFNESEKAYFTKHNSPEMFLQLWTAKEAFVKCYYIEHYKNPDFDQWKLIETKDFVAYTNGKEIYECNKGISDTHIFAICNKK